MEQKRNVVWRTQIDLTNCHDESEVPVETRRYFTKSHANLRAPNRGIKADLTDDIGAIVQDGRRLGEKSRVCVRDQNASKYVNIPGSKNSVVGSKATTSCMLPHNHRIEHLLDAGSGIICKYRRNW